MEYIAYVNVDDCGEEHFRPVPGNNTYIYLQSIGWVLTHELTECDEQTGEMWTKYFKLVPYMRLPENVRCPENV